VARGLEDYNVGNNLCQQLIEGFNRISARRTCRTFFNVALAIGTSERLHIENASNLCWFGFAGDLLPWCRRPEVSSIFTVRLDFPDMPQPTTRWCIRSI